MYLSPTLLKWRLSSSNVGAEGRGQCCEEWLKIPTLSHGLSAKSFKRVCRWGNMSLRIPIPATKAICKIYPDKPRLKIYKEEGVSGIQLTSLAWSHDLADTAPFHSCQTVSISTRPCVSESQSDYTAVCRTEKQELKDVQDARHQLQNLHGDRKQIQVPLQIQSQVCSNPQAIVKAGLEFTWQPCYLRLNGGLSMYWHTLGNTTWKGSTGSRRRMRCWGLFWAEWTFYNPRPEQINGNED